jgi:predicted Zn-dependent peptidase
MSTRRALTRTLLEGADGALVRRTTLPNGLRIVTEAVPGVRSVSFGAWIGVGSRDETPRQTGAAHFLEHLLFKGTQTRTSWEITAPVEAVGGELNAFTSKEYTCFYARVLDDDTDLAIDTVCDVVLNGRLDAADIEGERQVILEEIAMNDDDPGDVVHDVFMQTYYGSSPLGRPILGTQASLEALSPQAIRGFYRHHYVPSQMVVAAAGAVDHEHVVDRVSRAFMPRNGSAEPGGRALARRSPSVPGRGTRGVVHRPSEQAHLVVGLGGIRRTDDRRYALGVLNSALGGGMSSRLFQAVREQRGLCYSVYSFVSSFADTGYTGVYVGCLPDKLSEVLDISHDVIAEVAQHGLSDDEVHRGKGQLRGSVVLGQEDASSRMGRIAKGELLYGEIPSIDDILERIDAVTSDDVARLAADVLRAEPTYAAIGPFDELPR